ncbi:hypothetical protein AB0M95_22175 [Sphaerisporangium sp. NPDC051017]|uniref:hypothetical protein n=1 Tax=Sphaerisporangium sp. NPDC051017 TaxID=3154636 RepID=UPI003449702B
MYSTLFRKASDVESTHRQLPGLVWKVADLPRGDAGQQRRCRVILPFTMPRRMVNVIAPTRKLEV